MEQFIVKHSCGHEVTHAYAGPKEARRRREAWLAERPCQLCWRAEQTRAAASQSREWDLPPLEGSPDEKSWAEVVRTKAIAHNRDYHKRLVTSKGLDKQDETLRRAIVAAADEALREIEGQKSAAWWIEHRFDVLNHIKQKTASAIAPIVDSESE